MTQDRSQEKTLEELTRRAQALWGSSRAETLRSLLRDTAGQLSEIRRNPPENNEEPGFYQ